VFFHPHLWHAGWQGQEVLEQVWGQGPYQEGQYQVWPPQNQVSHTVLLAHTCGHVHFFAGIAISLITHRVMSFSQVGVEYVSPQL